MKWFNNLKVGAKVLLSCLLFIILIIAIAVQGITSNQSAADAFDAFYADRFVPVRQLNLIAKGILQVRINMLQEKIAVQLNDPDEFEKRLASSNEIHRENAQRWEAYMATQLTTEEKKMADDFAEYYENMKEIAVEFVNCLRKNDIEGSGKVSDRWVQEYRKGRGTMDNLIGLQQSIGEELKKDQAASAENVMILSIVLLALAIFVGVVITIILSRAVSRPVNKGLEFANKIAAGDLTDRIDLDQKDELGQLGAALNEAADNLESLVSNVIVGAQGLAQAVEQIASGNQNLSQRTSEQASSLEEIASTIEETTATINQNAENAGRANDQAQNTSKMAQEGSNVVTDAVNSINDINQSSKKIADIISMINEISFQTNLLALNAAVEAARAGEQGRGFAVVAGEVRNLAQRSATAAKEISVLIQDSVDKIDGGTNLVNKSGEALKEIIESVTEVGKVISEIAAASQEQKQGIGQVNTAVTEMDTMTQQNAALVEETASASEEMANQAQELLAMVEKFKVRDLAAGRNQMTAQKNIHLRLNESTRTGKYINTTSANKTTEKAKIHQLASHTQNTVTNTGTSAPAPAGTQGRGEDFSRMMKEEGFEEF